ncbi:uncharacterized protein LOC123980884 isoform X2 [Micropterus dolomieu]|uniref:uncharacterized protein LOC123980884 isoform X2 n=1 Tax=Micropterus dolomieu TaxID=147949 RepID=UPI001E8D76D9|nr:uncharacterized protein LOC123980884 isoform X2 [Micropterus dolomieu]
MEPGAPDIRNMSTAEILRGIVAEKLTTAAQEIVAVVERTVAGYEEEASGLRQEIDRQRRQLEAVLQLEIKLEPADDQFPVCGPAAGGGQLPAEEAQHKNYQSMGDSGSMGLQCYTEAHMEEDEEEDQDQEHLSEPDNEEASRSLTPTLQSDRRAGRPQISESQDHVDLRICILEDSRIKVLSVHMYQKYPVHEMRCPRGLQEADFLDLLRSTFPQLAAHKPFDVFICQKNKKLQPLKVKTLTPEEICQSISFTGRSAIYIRLKSTSFENQAEELTSTDEEFHPSHRNDVAAHSPSTPDQTSLLSPRVQSDRSRSSRPQINVPQNLIDLRICILDSHIDVLSSRVYKKYPVLLLQCPGGLQEADFLDLLRSTFPQLVAQKDFDFFTTDLKKKLQPLKVKTLTPEEIFRSISSTGRSALYIRLKNTSLEYQAEELKSTDEEFHPSQRNDAAADSPSSPDQTSLLFPRVQSDRSRSSIPWISEPQNHVDLRICILDSQIDVLSTKVYRKYPVMELQCRGGLQEADFLDLLRSTFPQLAAQKDFDFFTADLKKKLRPLKVKTLTPEEIWRIVGSTGSSAIYIRPKNTSFGKQGEELMSTDEEFHPSQKNDAAADSPSTPDQTSLLLPRVQSDRKRSSKPQINEPPNHVDLRICILDSEINVLSINVYKKYPVQRVQCPGGLHEADFLDLLRSTFPKLADQKDFDFFTTDRKKKLEPLKVETLTPKEIWRTISSTGYSALYIRLKQSEEVEARVKEPQTKGAAFKVQLHRRRSRIRRSSELQNHIDLRICIVEDPQLEALSARVYKKYPVLLLQCPRGLQEADFLDLLRSTFPQLAGQKHFDFFTTDLKKRLHHLKVKILTPEEICSTISSAGHSALYIRLKPPAQVKTREKVPQRKDAATDSPSTDQTSLNTRDQSDSSRSGRPQDSEPQKHVDLRICVLEDSQLDVLSTRVYRKYPVLELQFPGGLQELDFLDLLRSTFPQLAAQKHFDFFTTDLKKKLQPLKVEMLTPEEISRSIRHSALYIRLKAQEEVRSNKEELRHADAAKDSSSTDQTSLNTSSRHEDHEDMETEDTDEDEDGGRSESAGLPVLSEGAGDGDDLSDDDRKQDTSEKHLRESEPEKTTRKKRVKTKRRKRMKASTDKSDAFLSCKVCRAPRTSRNMLIKHAWRHVDDPERLCGVCGEQAESVEELRSHLQSHQKTHRCNVCGKSFLSTHGLSGHVARHKGKKPYECNICHKSYAQNWVLNHHKWVHEADRPHKCDICQKSFYSKMVLKRHKVSHTGETLHRCETCGKSLSSLVSLSQHILRHSAKKAEFACEICSRRFNTNQKLKMHRRSHCKEEPHVCSKCSKGFSSSSMLAAHMRVHTGEKPYKCSVCDMAFSHKHCMKRHMTTHPVGSDLCKTEAQNLSDRINGAKSVEPVL